MTAPAQLYTGHTVHERRAPFLHRFRYRLALMAVDLDRLDEAGRLSRLFSVEKFNLFSFRARDHGARDGSSLKDWAETQLAAAGIEGPFERIRLLCSPRVLGYVFNPLSIYFAEAPGGVLRGVIYQVHNTFGDAHAYVARVEGDAPWHHSADKVFHVSPFFDVAGRYDFTLRNLGDTFSMSILKTRAQGPDFYAGMQLSARPLTSGALAKLFASQPFSTLKTILAIHGEALRLVFKGARYHPRPEPPGEPSFALPDRDRSVVLGRSSD